MKNLFWGVTAVAFVALMIVGWWGAHESVQAKALENELRALLTESVDQERVELKRLETELEEAKLRQGLPPLLQGATYAIHTDVRTRDELARVFEAFGARPAAWVDGEVPYLIVRQDGVMLNARWPFNERLGKHNPVLSTAAVRHAAFAIALDAGSWRNQELNKELAARVEAAYAK
jgi:hypothetical protein